MSLALEHLEISLIAIFIAIIFGGIVGILISEYQRYAKPALGLINSFDRPSWHWPWISFLDLQNKG